MKSSCEKKGVFSMYEKNSLQTTRHVVGKLTAKGHLIQNTDSAKRDNSFMYINRALQMKNYYMVLLN